MMNKTLMQKYRFFNWVVYTLFAFNVALLTSGLLYYSRICSFPVPQVYGLQNEVEKEVILSWFEDLGRIKRQEIVEEISIENLESNVSYLSSTIGIRVAGSNKEHETADWLEQELISFGYKTEQQAFTLTSGLESRNVIAYKEAEFKEGEKTIIIGAHYDSTETSPGAMDNASGVSSVLEIARVLKDFDQTCNLVFVLFSAEECVNTYCTAYHQGSIYYVSQLSDFEKGQIYGMINLDVIGATEQIQIRREAGLSDSFAEEVFDSLNTTGLQSEIVQSKNWGDHESFEVAKIQAVFIFTPGFEEGHSPQDTIDKVNFERVEEITKGVVWYLVNKEC